MFGKNKTAVTKVDKDLDYENMKKKPAVSNYVTTGMILSAFAALGIYCMTDGIRKGVNESIIIGVCLVGIAFYIFLIAPISHSSDRYRFEFRQGKGLADFKLFYNDREVKVEYKLDKTGRFMWKDMKRKPDCLSYADGKKMDLYFTKYRVLNYVNLFMKQNDLLSDNAW
ncbi:MAG: hypothetical protein K6G69_00215 [Lachnospiraceae bacterium]|nr:hypothetical protein [Lachnospiraceae bacterium]